MGDLENTLAHELLAEVNDLFAPAEADTWAGDLCQALRKWLFRVCYGDGRIDRRSPGSSSANRR